MANKDATFTNIPEVSKLPDFLSGSSESEERRIISMVRKNYPTCLKLIALAAALPFLYGCGAGGGAGIGSLVGFLFGSGGGGIGDVVLGGGSGIIIGPGGGGTLINPEPASMLLVGSGLMAMSYFKSKRNNRSK